MSQQKEIERQTRDWVTHDIGTISSFANMERTLEREYYGRFLIELIQNARDAWFELDEQTSRDAVVRILLHGAQPVVTVANQGVAINARTLLAHITQFGESSKRAGAGIGHKGIGLKSILEITHTPQILSREQPSGPFSLAVQFDPQQTERLLDAVDRSPWSERVQAYDPGGKSDKDQRLPILRFPHWLEAIPEAVDEEAEARLPNGELVRFHTLIRLPHDALLGQVTWLTRVRKAMAELGDEILILLDAFRYVLLEDRLLDPPSCINITIPLLETRPIEGGQRRLVEVYRGQQISSQWLLYERRLEGVGDGALAGEITVGVRLRGSLEDGWALELPEHRTFHLFFPTQIDCGLPLLLHAYFEVDAGRTRFAPDATDKNQHLLDALRSLAVCAVSDLVADPQIDHRNLAELLAAAATGPGDALAASFREDLLAALDEVAWIPTRSGDMAAPRDVLVADSDELAELLPQAFPSGYLCQKVDGVAHPASMSAAARGFLATRAHRTLLKELPCLLRPEGSLWEGGPQEIDQGFRALMRVLQIVRTNHPEAWEALCQGLIGDERACFIPVVSSTPAQSRRLVAPSDRRRSGTALFARERRQLTERESQEELGVPACLNMAFLPGDTMTLDVLGGAAQDLGIRQYNSDTVLEQLDRCRGTWLPEAAKGVSTFVWRLLLRESVSSFGLKTGWGMLSRFEPGRLFWCRPNDVQIEDKRRKMYMRRGLAAVPLPSAAGVWQSAGQLCFGEEWAQADPERAEAYADLVTLAPGLEALLAQPADLAAHLPLHDEDLSWLTAELLSELGFGECDEVSQLSAAERVRLHHALLHLLALSLGVWETPPVEGVVGDLRPEADEVDPWADRPDRAAWMAHVQSRCREWFGVSYFHRSVRVAADCRLLWPLKRADAEQQVCMARALTRAAPVLHDLLRAPVLCHSCGNHRYRRWASFSPPSMLAWQLQRTPWVPVTVNAQSAEPRLPSESWWMADPPDDPARIATQPRRYISLVRRGLSFLLIEAVGGRNLEQASPPEIRALLTRLRDSYSTGSLVIDPDAGSSARQAFVGLHRLLYLRLSKTASPEQAGAILDEVGVLTRIGGKLCYASRRQALYDPGDASAFRQHFYRAIHFAPLNVGEGDIAHRLGITSFRVDAALKDTGEREEQTDVLRAFLDERLVEIMALLSLMGLGGQTLSLDSEDFRRRSLRLQQLRCFRVPDVVLTLTVAVPDSEPIVKTIWEGSDSDVFLRDGRSPELYHDFLGEGWFDTLRERLGPVVARLVENDAYRDTFSLFFQTPDIAREAFLQDRGILSADRARIQRALERAGVTASTLSQTWWATVLTLLEQSGAEPHAALCAAGVSRDAADVIVEAGGGESVRADDGPGGVLSMLSAFLDLRALHEQLRAAGDPGLRLHAGAEQLRRWKSEHGAKAAFALTITAGMEPAEASRHLRGWSAPPFDPDPSLDVLLAPIARELGVPAAALYPERIDAALAEQCGIGEEQWPHAWRELFSEDERKLLARRRAQAWRTALKIPAVALLTAPGEAGYRIRSIAERYDQKIPIGLSDPLHLAPHLAALLEDVPDAGGLLALVEAVRDPLAPPPIEALWATLDEERRAHADEIREVLAVRQRVKLDRLRRAMDELVQAGVAPQPHRIVGVPTPRKPRAQGNARKVQKGKVHRTNLHQIGAIGEMRALAAVVRPLEDLLRQQPDRFVEVIEELKALLVYWEGPPVEELLSHAASALDDTRSHEERLESLVSFVHISEVSDGFGCDMLGWLPAAPDTPPRPLALEVKTVSSRHGVLVSRNEWSEAERLGEDYALMVVLRKKAAVAAIDLIVDPRGASAAALVVETETWRVGYDPGR